MTPRAAITYLAVMCVMFALVAYTAGVAHRVADQRDRAEMRRLRVDARLEHLSERCSSDPQGGAVCAPGSFDVAVTTTTVAE